jgi:hypothetical protein
MNSNKIIGFIDIGSYFTIPTSTTNPNLYTIELKFIMLKRANSNSNNTNGYFFL